MPKKMFFSLKTSKSFKSSIGDLAIRLLIFLYELQEKRTVVFVVTYLTVDELAEYLKVAVQTVRRWVLNREVPFHKIKKVIRFRVSEIEKWVDGGGCNLPEEKGEGIEGDLFADEVVQGEFAEMENGGEA
jgi:excisionase family DNA binding protein